MVDFKRFYGTRDQYRIVSHVPGPREGRRYSMIQYRYCVGEGRGGGGREDLMGMTEKLLRAQSFFLFPLSALSFLAQI